MVGTGISIVVAGDWVPKEKCRITNPAQREFPVYSLQLTVSSCFNDNNIVMTHISESGLNEV